MAQRSPLFVSESELMPAVKVLALCGGFVYYSISCFALYVVYVFGLQYECFCILFTVMRSAFDVSLQLTLDDFTEQLQTVY